MRKLIPINRHKEWMEEYRIKCNAHSAVSAAIRTGRLVREACADCGDGSSKTHGHHEDYSKQLDVIWLCRKCHVARHTPRINKGKCIGYKVYYYYEETK